MEQFNQQLEELRKLENKMSRNLKTFRLLACLFFILAFVSNILLFPRPLNMFAAGVNLSFLVMFLIEIYLDRKI